MLADEVGSPCKGRGSPIPPMASEVRRTGFGGKSVDVTQGDLIVSAECGNFFAKTVTVKVRGYEW